MNILFLTSRIPYPPNRGDKLRTNFLLRDLSKKHKIFLFSFVNSDEEKKYYDNLEPYCVQIFLAKQNRIYSFLKLLLGLFNKFPFQVIYYNSRRYLKKIRQIVVENKIDCVYTHLIRMAPFAQNLTCYKILDYTDSISKEYSRSIPFRKNFISKMFFRIEAKRTEKYEKDIINYFNEGWFICQEDIETLGFSRESKIKVIANPISLDYEKRNYERNNIITFVGNLSVPHNISAVEYIYQRIMPELIKINENIQFHIVGANPIKLIKEMNGKNNTQVLGFVENLYDKLIESDLFVAPIFFSAGIQNKVLEAMSVGLPVITTQNISNSLNTQYGNEIIVANDEKEFIKYILNMLDNCGLRERIGRNGRKFVRDNFNRKKISQEIEKTLYMIEKLQKGL